MKIFKKVLALSLSLLVAILPVAQSSADVLSTTFYHNDALGSPVAATDENGNVKWREQYKPYGEKVINELEAVDNSRWYTGHPHDEETGLTYAGARYYDPVIGRFMGIDPVGFSPSDITTFNRYSYVGNNPYSYKDPNGETRIGINFMFNIALGSVGGKVRFDINYDTTHGEVNLRATGGYKAGAQLGVKLEAYTEPSDNQPTGNRLAIEGKLKVEAVGEVKTPVGTASAIAEAFASGELSTDRLIDGDLDANVDAEASWGPVSVDDNGRSSIGVGGNVGVAGSAEVTGKITLSPHGCSPKTSC